MGGDLFHRKLYMMNDRPIDVVPYLADLLEAGIPVLVYNGDRDMTTCATGSELLLNGMEWSGKEEWLDATRGIWMVENVKGGEGGWAKEYRGLTFVVIYNSGHSKYTFLGHVFAFHFPDFFHSGRLLIEQNGSTQCHSMYNFLLLIVLLFHLLARLSIQTDIDIQWFHTTNPLLPWTC